MSAWNRDRPGEVGKAIHLIDLQPRRLGLKSGFCQTRPDAGFTACSSASSTGESEMEPRTMKSGCSKDVWSKHFSRAFFRLCSSEDPLWRCPQAKHQVRECVKTSTRCEDVGGENADTGSPQTDTMLWERWRYSLSVSAAAIGSVTGSLLAQGPGDLSSAERGVVTVIYGCCNPCSESPDVYPTPYFLLLKGPRPGILNLRRD